MADIPLDLQRRFEERWAARFLRPAAPKKQGLERQDQQLTEPGKSKGKTRRTKSVGIRFCTVGVSAGPKPAPAYAAETGPSGVPAAELRRALGRREP